ncbi:condensin complex subunit 3 [Rhodotorula toruloides]|uniref:Condensin complex subunit 3 n=1 Tax=Rhodotorula toruloides TaxID=5286 RepID=A0A511KH47_RHOTO|nr:condensin complex subunit 3 [Rhodotorula toruloides]
MPARLKRAQPAEPDSLDSLTPLLDEQLPALFTAAQHTTASHRKHINTLHSVFLRCSKVTTLSADGRFTRLSGEKAFGEKFREMVTHPLGVKKGADQGDRVIKFVAGFVGFAVEYDFKQREANDEDEDEDGPASRLVAQLLAFLLRGFQAKNKIARYRCVQLVALMINSLGEIDDESYHTLKAALLERIRDKEASVRQHAVVALSKLQDADEGADDSDGGSDDEEEGKETKSVTEVLVSVLNHDPAAEVRRAALFNLIPSATTLPHLLRRTLDIDTTNRRLAFSHVLVEIPPRSLTKTQRREIMGRGLRDREEAVRKAAKKLVAKWLEQVDKGDGGEATIEAFVSFFDLFDEDGQKVAEKALEALFEVRPDLIQDVEFSDDFYRTLMPPTAFLVRVYLNYLRNVDSPLLADLEPVVTALAFHLQAAWTQLVVALEADERDEDKEAREEFIVGELVGIAVNLDYGDEIGRRKMFELMREMLQHSLLPPSLIPKCLDVLLKGTSERDFMRIVVETVQSLRNDSHLVTDDSELGEQSDDSSDDSEELEYEGDAEERAARRRLKQAKKGKRAVQEPQQAERRKELDLRCLFVVKALLERVMSALQENSMLHGLVAELIVPSVKTKDYEVRAQGLICLGLCCLLDKSMALDSFQLLARQSEATEGELQIKVLQTLFDLLVLHGINFGEERGFGTDIILGFLGSSLDQEDPKAAATAVVGIAKLMLSGMVTDEEILARLALLYFAGETADNPELRQCLSYFFPVYCYSNPQNQRRVSTVMIKTLDVLRSVYDELKDKSTMVTPLQIGSQLVDWTDPQKVIESDTVQPDETVQVDLALKMLKALYKSEEKDVRKLWCQLLPKLYIPDETDDLKIKALVVMIEELKTNRPLADAVPRNALNRFEASLVKTYGARLEALEDAQVEESDDVRLVREWVAKVEGEEEEYEGEDDDDEEEEESEEESEAE